MPQPLLFYGQRILEAGAILPLFTRGMIGNAAPRSPKPTSTVGVPGIRQHSSSGFILRTITKVSDDRTTSAPSSDAVRV